MIGTATPPTLSMRESAAYVGKHYEVFRQLVRAGVFTRVIFSAAKKRPPASFYVHELDAWRAGGVDAVRAARAAAVRVEKRRKATKVGV